MDDSGATSKPEALPPSVKIQILATEHWSLLAARTMTWNESFSRASMFFTLLSGAIVALALVAQATSFGKNFTLFALLLLPLVVLTGLLTFVRLHFANNYDMLQVVGMNRIRHAYLEIAPELEPYFITGHHDDAAGVLVTSGMTRLRIGYLLASTPFLVAVVDAIVAAGLAGFICDALGFDRMVSAIVGIVCGILFLLILITWVERDLKRTIGTHRPRFPTPSQSTSNEEMSGAR
jgi:hypothetical protein